MSPDLIRIFTLYSHTFPVHHLIWSTSTVLFTVAMAKQKISGIKKSHLQHLNTAQASKRRKLDIEVTPEPEPIPNHKSEEEDWYFNNSSDSKGFDSSKKEGEEEEEKEDD